MDDILFEFDMRPNTEISKFDPVEWMGFNLKIDNDGYLIYRKYTFESLRNRSGYSKDDYITQVGSVNLEKLKTYIADIKPMLSHIPGKIKNGSIDGRYFVIRFDEKSIEGANILSGDREDSPEQFIENTINNIKEILLEDGIVMAATKVIIKGQLE